MTSVEVRDVVVGLRRHYKGGWYVALEVAPVRRNPQVDVYVHVMEGRFSEQRECSFSLVVDAAGQVAVYPHTSRYQGAEGEVMVVYYSLARHQVWARPLAMFEGRVEVDGRSVARFERPRSGDLVATP